MRTYASFFEWHDKGRKELGVVEELIEALNQSNDLGLHSAREFTPDPPDCVCLDSANREIAVEVAEVVCEKAARLNAQGVSAYRNWRRGELASQIARLLGEKDKKNYSGGPYQSTIICLFTDEPMLTVQFAREELSGQVFGPYRQVTSAYLLFSYEAATQSYPVVQLALRT